MRRRRPLTRSLLVLAVACVAVLAAGSALAAGHTVRATSADTWNPVKTTMTKGGKVTWSNPDSEAHNVVAWGGNWSYNKSLASGHSVSRVFSSTGTFKFRCTLHSYVSGGVCHGMCGRVVVHG
jgi:plastocyanin